MLHITESPDSFTCYGTAHQHESVSRGPPWRSDDYQWELRNRRLTLRAYGLELHSVGVHPVREGCIPAVSGAWRVKLGASLGPILEARSAHGYNPGVAAPFA